jgi:hypothetical protein
MAAALRMAAEMARVRVQSPETGDRCPVASG